MAPARLACRAAVTGGADPGGTATSDCSGRRAAHRGARCQRQRRHSPEDRKAAQAGATRGGRREMTNAQWRHLDAEGTPITLSVTLFVPPKPFLHKNAGLGGIYWRKGGKRGGIKGCRWLLYCGVVCPIGFYLSYFVLEIREDREKMRGGGTRAPERSNRRGRRGPRRGQRAGC